MIVREQDTVLNRIFNGAFAAWKAKNPQAEVQDWFYLPDSEKYSWCEVVFNVIMVIDQD